MASDAMRIGMKGVRLDVVGVPVQEVEDVNGFLYAAGDELHEKGSETSAASSNRPAGAGILVRKESAGAGQHNLESRARRGHPSVTRRR